MTVNLNDDTLTMRSRWLRCVRKTPYSNPGHRELSPGVAGCHAQYGKLRALGDEHDVRSGMDNAAWKMSGFTTRRCPDAGTFGGGTCTGGCAASQICDQQACQGCDVCASGCAHTTVQPAINAASAGGTIRICAGTYARDGEAAFVTIAKSLTLVGAGADAIGTTLHGNGSLTLWPVVLVSGVNTVFLGGGSSGCPG